jgi:hypothetical protein
MTFQLDISQIEIGQGDGEDVPAILKEDGIGADLSGATSIIFVMRKDLRGNRYEVPCNDGAIINGVTIPKKRCGMSIAFSEANTPVPGDYFGKFLVTIDGAPKSFPNVGYVTVRVNQKP